MDPRGQSQRHGGDASPERTRTDDSLRVERGTTDVEIAKTQRRIEQLADEQLLDGRAAAERSRELSRATADAQLRRAGASAEITQTAQVERKKEDATTESERSDADVGLESERLDRHRAIAKLLRDEREQTDAHLLLERSGSDDAMGRMLGELAEAVRLREDFLSVASHELNTPLTPLVLRLRSLELEANRQPDSPFARHVKSYVEAANRQVRRLSGLVASLLDVSRIAAGKLHIELEPVDLGAIVHSVATRAFPAIEGAGCTLELDAPSVVGHWDELRLEQTVANLLNNAVKYAPGKCIRITLRSDGKRAVLEVQDEGGGIEQEHLSRIFGRFERAAPVRNYGGLGLGLYICHTIVEALGGTIEARSATGEGSTFTVILPIAGPARERS